jgi:hypothetical protein
MANSLNIECADRSVRWYLTPGQSSRYEVLVINQSGDERVECAMSLDDPPQAGVFEPATFALRPRERKTVSLTFGEEAQVPRDQRALISVRDPDGIVIASFEHGLISAGGIDCTIQLAWKEPILDGDSVRGFVVSCAIKSLSASPGQFGLQFTPHPSLEFVDVTPIKLQPGQTETVAVPILWKRAVKDADGNNHPRAIEIGVAVSQGKRTGRLQWDAVEARLAEFAKKVERVEAAAPAPAPASAPGPAPLPSAATPAASDNGAYQAPLFEIANGAVPPATVAASSAALPAPIVPVVDAPLRALVEPVSPTPEPNAHVESPPTPSAKPNSPPPDFERPEDDEALMSLLVGKPVSPPDGWRGPGRDAPDVPTAPPSIFARTPSSVVAPPPQQPPPQPTPPRQPRPTPPEPTPTSTIPPPYRRAPAPPTAAAAEAQTSSSVRQGVDVAQTPQEPDPFEALEASIVGPPPSLARALESGREMTAANARRTVDYIEPSPSSNNNKVPTFIIGGTALLAALLGAFLIFRPQVAPPAVQPQAVPTATVPPPVVLVTPQAAPSRAGVQIGASPGAKTSNQPVAPAAAASAAARIASQATQRAVVTTAPAATVRPAARPSVVALAQQPPHKPHPRPTHRPLPASRNTIVSLVQGVDAHYGPQGHAVRVLWGANGQASAHIMLQDDKGSVLSETDVAGTRQSALLYVPRTYHGAVYVQVVSQGALGERVTQSTTLPPFAH